MRTSVLFTWTDTELGCKYLNMDHTHFKKEKLIKVQSEILCTRPEMPCVSKQSMIITPSKKVQILCPYLILSWSTRAPGVKGDANCWRRLVANLCPPKPWKKLPKQWNPHSLWTHFFFFEWIQEESNSYCKNSIGPLTTYPGSLESQSQSVCYMSSAVSPKSVTRPLLRKHHWKSICGKHIR